MTLSNWDSQIRLGVWPFSLELEEGTELYRIVREHDLAFDLIRNGEATFTLKEADRNLFKNLLFYAAGHDLWIDRFSLARQAWIAYKACRAWAKYVRPELEAWRPNASLSLKS